jgi:hypothetical protein
MAKLGFAIHEFRWGRDRIMTGTLVDASAKHWHDGESENLP